VAPELEPQASLPWFIRLRWVAVAGQSIGLALGWWVLELPYAWSLLAALVVLTAASNVALSWAVKRRPRAWPASRTLGWVLTFDTLILTALLAGSGGPMNPFTVFYLVHITLSAVVLSARWTTWISALSIGGFAALFALAPSSHSHHHHMAYHLEGMWVAFVLAAASTGFFMRRIAQSIAQQREEIAALRETSQRTARLAAVTTLAAGAAHELGSPLGTIAVAAHEAARALETSKAAGALADDLALIQLEVERCHEILSKMAQQASEPTDQGRAFSFDELVETLRNHLNDEERKRVEFDADSSESALAPSLEQLSQSVTALIRNALDASPTDQNVGVKIRTRGTNAEISVSDRGSGIPPDVLSRVGDPFFTTKQPGRGLGLGVFLARACAESLGGMLSIDSTPGQGTRAVLSLPLRPIAGAS
jgi:two-component system, sensor histidine kinase RegB